MEDDKNSGTRGYDDNAYLKEMADGIIARRFASVDEAARTVLGEEPGSNVDRLRRKFREQGWYERGLNDYVEAEIARRGANIETLPDVYLFKQDGRPRSPLETRVMVLARDLWRGLIPKGPAVFLTILVTAWLMNIHAGVVNTGGLLSIMVTLSFMGLMNWGHEVARSNEKGVLTKQFACLAVVIAGIIAVFEAYMPDSAYAAGSLAGSATLAMGTMLLGFFVTERIQIKQEREGRKGKEGPDISMIVTLIVMGAMISQLPVGVTRAITRDAAVIEAKQKMETILSDIRKVAPDYDVAPIQEVQEKLLRSTIRPPEWGRQTAE